MRRVSRAIQAAQQTTAKITGAVGKKTIAAIQAARKSNQREKAALKRLGTGATPGEYAKDFTLRNQPFAISAAMNRGRGGGALSISGWSSCAASSVASPAARDRSMALHACCAVGRATVPFRFSADGTERQR